jgi:hypothetical protein
MLCCSKSVLNWDVAPNGGRFAGESVAVGAGVAVSSDTGSRAGVAVAVAVRAGDGVAGTDVDAAVAQALNAKISNVNARNLWNKRISHLHLDSLYCLDAATGEKLT